MAQQRPSQSVAILRIVTYRLSSTPTKQLPHIASQLAGSLWNCRDILSSPSQAAKSNSEVSTLVHRFKTTLSSLLQDRTVEGRWAAVVLVKAAVEAGGVETLSQSGPWIRNLLAVLKKPDPPTTHIFAVSILTRIFMLTWDSSNLIRELTTPNLPAFVSTCLNNIESRQRCSPGELQAILEAFAVLLPRHPTIFRSHENQIRVVLLKILSGTSNRSESEIHYTDEHKLIAHRVFALLHHCAPKQGGAAKWNETVTATILAAHATCDHLFRSIKEDWSSNSGVQKNANAANLSAAEMESSEQDGLGLSGWKGVFGAEERLSTLLGLLQCHIEISTAGSVAVPIGLMLDLLSRLLSVIVPKSGSLEQARINPQIPKDERESMFSVLPSIHVSALQVILTVLSHFGAFISPVTEELLENVLVVFNAEKSHVDIRTTTYRVVQSILELTGPSMSKDTGGELSRVIKACCDDLLSGDAKDSASTAKQANSTTAKQQTPATDLSLVQSSITSTHPTSFTDLSEAAQSLLAVSFTKLNPIYLPRKVRVQMERTAVLTKNREALIACVMNPAKKDNGKTDQASLLPLLARLYPDAAEVEALLRPRMPVVRLKGGAADEDGESEIEDDEMADEDGVNGESMDAEEEMLNGSLVESNASSMTVKIINGQNHDTEDELYTASPRPALPQNGRLSGAAADTDLAKRPAVEPLDETISAKRLRPSSVARSLEPESASDILGSNSDAAPVSIPVTVAMQDDVSTLPPFQDPIHTATLPPEPTSEIVSNPSANSSTRMRDVDRDEDDLSESEIPALDAGLDTDPEDDEDDDDGEEL